MLKVTWFVINPLGLVLQRVKPLLALKTILTPTAFQIFIHTVAIIRTLILFKELLIFPVNYTIFLHNSLLISLPIEIPSN
jgi:hypothetical protein